MSQNNQPNFAQILEQNLMSMKKRTSQIKGELNDGLTETISKNFEQFFQLGQQLTGQIDAKDKEIQSLKKELEDVYNAHPELKVAKEVEAKGKAKK